MRISDWSSDVCSSDLRKAMAARGLTVADVEAALRRENVELPAGRLESATRDFTLRIERGYANAAQFRRMALIKGADEIGRAPRRERVCKYVEVSVGAVALKKHTTTHEKKRRIQ